jgi:hypothetical protein
MGTNSTVNPVQARKERKEQTRLQLERNKATRGLCNEFKGDLKDQARRTQERIRATTPEIRTLDVIEDRRTVIQYVEDATNAELIRLRRRLVTAERLVETRTRERDAANRAHKAKVHALENSRAAHAKIIKDKNSVITYLHNKIETKTLVGSNGVHPVEAPRSLH